MHPAIRSAWLSGILMTTLGRAAVSRSKRNPNHSDAKALKYAAAWTHEWSKRALARLKIGVRFEGPVPTYGLVVANHLSYLDPLLFAAATPCIFVCKSDVRAWPLVGMLAVKSGAIFVDREHVCDASRTVSKIASALNAGVVVVLFPEGTTSDGSGILQFRSALFEAAVRCAVPVLPTCVRYEAPRANVARDVCYWGEAAFLPHFLNLLSKSEISGTVRFAPRAQTHSDRKRAARSARSEVVGLLNFPQPQRDRLIQPAVSFSLTT